MIVRILLYFMWLAFDILHTFSYIHTHRDRYAVFVGIVSSCKYNQNHNQLLDGNVLQPSSFPV